MESLVVILRRYRLESLGTSHEARGFGRTAHCAWSKHEKLLSVKHARSAWSAFTKRWRYIYSLAYQQSSCNQLLRQPASLSQHP